MEKRKKRIEDAKQAAKEINNTPKEPPKDVKEIHPEKVSKLLLKLIFLG